MTAAPPNQPSAAPQRFSGRLAGGVSSWWRRNQVVLYALVLCIVFAVMAAGPRMFVQIPAGHVGVLWLRFWGGTVTSHVYHEGMRVILPWDRMYIYDARIKTYTRVYRTISQNGLSMDVEVSVQYKINPERAGLLHKVAGPQYPESIVFPEIASVALETFAGVTPEQMYSQLRGEMQQKIRDRLLTRLDSGTPTDDSVIHRDLITIENVLLRSVALPQMVNEAIERKLEQQQKMLEWDYRIEREEKERTRKRIEAEGIRHFQDTVAQTITPEYLRLRGIEATNNIATSPNAKIIIIGGKDGLPVILNTGDAERPNHPPAGPVPAFDATTPAAPALPQMPP